MRNDKVKKSLIVIVLILFGFSLLAYSSADFQQFAAADETDKNNQNNNELSNNESQVDGSGDFTEENNETLIVYFSVPEGGAADTVASASRVVVENEVVGNTELVAGWIQQSVGGYVFTIETIESYPDDHDDLVDKADQEQEVNARPELANQLENIEDYDTIFLGFPIWWADLPMPVYTFLEEYDLSGKTVIPFSTHGGSGFSSTIETITEMESNAEVINDGITISRNNVPDSESEVNNWLEELNI